MVTPPDETTADPHAVIAALRAAGLTREAGQAETLAARTAELATRNSEYGERIEHQSATIDVLKAMSSSPGDAQPVFDLIVSRAKELCDAFGVSLHGFDGELVHFRAWGGVDPVTLDLTRFNFPRSHRGIRFLAVPSSIDRSSTFVICRAVPPPSGLSFDQLFGV